MRVVSKNTRQLIVNDDPKSISSEAFRTLRTNLQFIPSDTALKVIMGTSAGPGEGKSTTISNLAVSIAQSGKSVLIIDCDLRKPVIHSVFKLNNTVGLTSVLTGQASLDEAIQESHIEGLHILTSGVIPPNPAELLDSERMNQILGELKNKYQQIILDAPPILPVADPLILAPKTDGVILVIAANKVPKDIALRAKNMLVSSNAKILGTVLNGVRHEDSGDHYYYYTYYSEDTLR